MSATLYFLKDRNESVVFKDSLAGDDFGEAMAQSLLLAVRGIPTQVWNNGAIEPYTAPDWETATGIYTRIRNGTERECSQRFCANVYNEAEFPPRQDIEKIVRKLSPGVAFSEELSDQSWASNFDDFLDAYDAPDSTFRYALNRGQP